MMWTGQVVQKGEKRNAYRLIRDSERKRPLGRQRRRYEANIRMHLVEKGWGDVNWIGLAQDRVKWKVITRVNAVVNLRVL
jgi:hypothetical protein